MAGRKNVCGSVTTADTADLIIDNDDPSNRGCAAPPRETRTVGPRLSAMPDAELSTMSGEAGVTRGLRPYPFFENGYVGAQDLTVDRGLTITHSTTFMTTMNTTAYAIMS